jgi:hypothetical protein
LANPNRVNVYGQELYDESAVAKHALGTILELEDSRVFAYSQAGGTALAAGKLNQSEAIEGDHINRDVPTAFVQAIGSKTAVMLMGATAAAENLYAEGYMWHNKNGVLGQMYKIQGHPQADLSTNLTLTLNDPLRVALADADEISVIKHPCKDLIISPTTLTSAPSGVAPIAVTADFFYWNQVKGPCAILAHGTLVVGDNVTPAVANTPIAGAVEASTEAVSVAAIVGTVLTIGDDTETAFIMLAIPGY